MPLKRQDDIMYETLTPRENLGFTAAFMLPHLTKEARVKAVELVIEKLNLKKASLLHYVSCYNVVLHHKILCNLCNLYDTCYLA